MSALILFALKYGFGIALLTYLIMRADLGEMVSIARSADIQTIMVALLVFVLAHAINAFKLRILIPEISFPRAFGFTFVGLYFSTVLPVQIAGDAIKATRMAGGINRARFLSITLFDRFTGIIALLTVTGFAITWEFRRFDQGLAIAIVAFLSATSVLLIALSLKSLETLLVSSLKILPDGSLVNRLKRALLRFTENWRQFGRDPSKVFWSIGVGIIFQLISILVVFLIARAIDLHLSYSVWAVIVGVVSFIVLLPVTVAGIGLREASMVGLLSAQGVSEPLALATSLAMLGFLLLAAVGGGIVDLCMGRQASRANQVQENREV